MTTRTRREISFHWISVYRKNVHKILGNFHRDCSFPFMDSLPLLALSCWERETYRESHWLPYIILLRNNEHYFARATTILLFFNVEWKSPYAFNNGRDISRLLNQFSNRNIHETPYHVRHDTPGPIRMWSFFLVLRLMQENERDENGEIIIFKYLI